MLLFEKKDYRSAFHVFGYPVPESHFHGSKLQLNTDYRTVYRRFAENVGIPVESFEFTVGENTVTLVGSIEVHPGAFTEEDKSHLTVLDLMIWHQLRKVTTPFNQWIHHNPFLRGKRKRGNFSIMYSDQGDYCLFYIEQGVVMYEKLTETCFIHNGIVTPLAAMVDKCEQAALKELEETRTFLAKIKNPSEWELAEALSDSDILRFVKDH